MNVLARHYVCFAGQLCGVSTDGTGFTAIVRRICVHVIGVIPATAAVSYTHLTLPTILLV